MDGGSVFEKSDEEQVQVYAGSGSGGIGDEVGDIAGTEREDELAEFQSEAEEETDQDSFAGGEIQQFQIDAEGGEKKDIEQDFLDVEADADVAGVVEGDEVEASRAD